MARVRIQAPTTSAAERTIPLPGVTEAPPATTSAPAIQTDDLGIKHVKCVCGLDVSLGVLKQNGGLCPSCKHSPVREQEIRDIQNAAIAKTQAAAAAAKAPEPPPDSERLAIQAEANTSDAKLAELKATLEAKVKADAAKEGERILAEAKAEREKAAAFDGGFFGPSNPPTNPAKELVKAMEQGLGDVVGAAMKRIDSAAVKSSTTAELDALARSPRAAELAIDLAHAGAPTNGIARNVHVADFASLYPSIAGATEYVDATWGMEKYNRSGTFSSYEVGPFGGRTAIRPGETRQQAHDRLYEELRAMAHKERDRKHAEFVEQFLKVQKG